MTWESKTPKPHRTRRTFLKSSAVAAAGLSTLTHSAAQDKASLALSGGSKAVSYPPDKHALASRWPLYGPEEEKLALEILHMNSSQCYRDLARLEEEWKAYHGVPYVQSHCNGTSALAAMFFALDLPPGSEIMVPSYTFFATIVPMRLFGLVPIFVDVDPRTANFDVQDARRRLTKRTKAILPVHFWGLPCEMDRLSAFANEHGLILLEDAAHAHGASMQGRLMGTWGAMSIFSYQATKPLPAMEGGMGMYQTQDYYERAATFGHYKRPDTFPKSSPYGRYTGTGLGLKFRMHPMAAALARCQLRKLDQRNAHGLAQVRALNDRLMTLPGLSEPYCRPDVKRLYYDRNMLFFDEQKAGFSRDALIKALRAEGVHASQGDYPLQHKNAIYAESQWWHHPPIVPEALPGSEQVNRNSVALPYFTSEVPELVKQYAKAFEKVWAHAKALAAL